jgi:hypothetical protein
MEEKKYEQEVKKNIKNYVFKIFTHYIQIPPSDYHKHNYLVVQR